LKLYKIKYKFKDKKFIIYIKYIMNSITNFLIYIYWEFMKIIIYIHNNVFSIYKYIFSRKHNDFNNIIVVKNAKIIDTIYNLEKMKLSYINYDYIIYKKYHTNKLLMNLNENINTLIPEQIIPCEFEFLFVSIKTTDNIYNITNILNNANHYYYVKNNILFNEIFMNWLYFFHLKLINSLHEYTITILDNKASEIIINNNQKIKLNINNYEIIN
tara:strand:- start:74621 stop:75262 length:642 start_codon:yes stop_codon:yes gene_type:complete